MGIKDTLRSLFKSNESTLEINLESKHLKEFDQDLKQVVDEINDTYNSPGWYSVITWGKLKSYKVIKGRSTSYKKELVVYLIGSFNDIKKKNNKKRSWTSSDPERLLESIYSELLSGLLRSDLGYEISELEYLLKKYKKSDEANIRKFVEWPIGFTIQQLERIIKKDGMSNELKTFLEGFLKWPQMKQERRYWGTDMEKVRLKIQKWVFEDDHEEGTILPYKLTADRFGKVVNQDIQSLDKDMKNSVYELAHLFITAKSSKPTQKYLKATSEVIDNIGIVKYKALVQPWIEQACALKEIQVTKTDSFGGRTYTYSTHEFIDEKNLVFLKGMVWSLVKFYDSKTLELVAKLAERSFKKIPGVGPAAAAVGNACLYVLANSKGLEGISHLSRLKLRIKQNSTRNLITKYLEEASKKLGISASEIEELSIPDFGLKHGEKSIDFEDYKLRLRIEDIGKVSSVWIKPDGATQKSTPSFINQSETHKKVLKKVKSDVAQIKKYLTAQRDRIDRIYLDDRVWSLENFDKFYLNHGLVSFITKRLLWQFKKGEHYHTAMWVDGKWVDEHKEVFHWIDQDTTVRLWHPIYASVDQIMFWRQQFEELEIKQPLKQVYREVYLLTDAEINTKTYSNRMAAHILKQHQFNALTSVRGWKYTLMGAFDNGVDAEMATIKMNKHDITAQYWINELNADDAFNDTGIWNYVATDQVRFIDKNMEVMDLVDVPKLVFTEVMRDVDLFVGVSSVGNDPEWRDNGGLPQYGDYWTTYSFGNLTEIAKTRKDIIEKLLPRLKIKKVAHIDGKFLIVKGSKRTYKIHIGSTNILMEPNDQYLCIVPARGKKAITDKVFLPFEGDRGLSLVLSKAFLLADDHKITDPTILSQINRS